LVILVAVARLIRGGVLAPGTGISFDMRLASAGGFVLEILPDGESSLAL
jgi:hypothetical protein